MNLNETKQCLQNYFRTKTEILAAYLFGSASKGRMRKNSDIDIAVLVDADRVKKPLRCRIEISTDLSDLLKRRIDIVILNYSNLLIRAQVFETGLLVYERSSRSRALFQAASMSRYYDYKRYFQYHADMLSSKIKETGLG
jgi:predicted nucleotidyltransferase